MIEAEEATGFTLYVETLRGLLAQPARQKRIFMADGIQHEHAQKLQAEGYVTVYALPEYGHAQDEALRLGCHWIFKDNEIQPIAKNSDKKE
jgi:ATP phosphoribosyltransferase regulatory subunit